MTAYFNVLDDWRKETTKVCFTNNDRKLHGLPMRRKADKRKKEFIQEIRQMRISTRFTTRFGNNKY